MNIPIGIISKLEVTFLGAHFIMRKKRVSLEVVNPYAAGIDIGSCSHWVSVGQDSQDVKLINSSEISMENDFVELNINLEQVTSNEIKISSIFNTKQRYGTCR